MLDSVGKKLEEARLQKKLTVEEAAFATKIRADRILDLEKDEYRNFPNLTYAKSFLVLYARFLGVNISDYTATLGRTNPVSVGDYEYLSHARVGEQPKARENSGRPLASLLIVTLLLLVAVIGFYLLISFQRIGARRTEEPVASTPAPTATPEPPPPAPSPTPAAETAAPVLAETPAPVAAAETPAPLEVRRAQPVSVKPSAEMTRISVKAVRKVHLQVRRENQQAPPIYDDILDPQAEALSFEGTRFWIHVGDKSSVKILRDGTPVGDDDPIVSFE